MASADQPALEPLSKTQGELTSEFRRRRKEYEFCSVLAAKQEELEKDGWEYAKKTRKRVRMRKRKALDERLENKFWCLLYRMGYPAMNLGRKFVVRYKQSHGQIATKQIDVFAKDDDTVIIAECKTCVSVQKRIMQKDIGELASLK